MLRGDLEGDDLEQYVARARSSPRRSTRPSSWARGNALFPVTFGLACCAIEMMSIVAARVDVARFGFEAFRASPRQADLLILSGRVSIKMAPVVRRIYDQMLEPKWAIAMGACSSSMGVFNNYAIVPADKFMPVDVHVPGCPPRPEALMHGILKLRSMIQDDPSLGWRERYNARRHRGARPRRADRQPGRQRLPAGGHRGCLTRPAWSCSPRSCARAHAGRASSTPSTSAARPRCTSRRPRSAPTLRVPARQGLHASWPACTASTTTPRSRASACSTSCSTWPTLDRITVKLRVPLDAAARRRRSRPTGRRPTTRSARSTTCSAWSSTATPTCAASSCPRTTRASRSAATSRSAASRCSSPRTRRSGGTTRHGTERLGVPPPGGGARRHRAARRRCSGDGPEQELLTLNMGPHHPATHGVLRLLVTLEGEVVRDLKPIIGYVHTGIEKTAEDKSYWKVIPVVERMDYLAYYFNAMAFCGAVETLLDVEVPKRAQYLRVIHLELNRIMSHLVWLGHERAGPRRDLDVLVLLPRARDDPRPLRDVLGPAHAHALHPGRRRHRGHPGRLRRPACAPSARSCPTASTSTATCWPRTRSSCSACATSAPLGQDDAARRSASPARCCAPPATRGTCARRCPTPPTRTSTSRSRSAPSATTTTASPCASPR